jgi:hypothetical protein
VDVRLGDRVTLVLYELRHYRTTLATASEFQINFGRDLLPVLQDCGFDLVGAWTVEIGDGNAADLKWMLRWSSLDERDAAYERVRSDARNSGFRDANLPFLVATSSEILRPTPFSPLV